MIQTFADNIYVSMYGGSEGLEQLRRHVKQPWMKLMGWLADSHGEQDFAPILRDSVVPQLRGSLVEANPPRRPKELRVPLPDAAGQPHAEITLRLSKALTGKPDWNTEFQWEGLVAGFARRSVHVDHGNGI